MGQQIRIISLLTVLCFIILGCNGNKDAEKPSIDAEKPSISATINDNPESKIIEDTKVDSLVEVEEYEPPEGRWEDYYNLRDEGYSHEEAEELLLSDDDELKILAYDLNDLEKDMIRMIILRCREYKARDDGDSEMRKYWDQMDDNYEDSLELKYNVEHVKWINGWESSQQKLSDLSENPNIFDEENCKFLY